MIIGSYTKLEIGEMAKGIVDNDYVDHPEQPFLVLRVATLEEYIKEANDENIKKLTQKEIAMAKAAGFFYEISLD